VTARTLYDVASLTKVCATTPLALRLIAQGKLGLDTKVCTLLPEFQGPGKERVTVRHLLTHSAGLVPYVQFFKTLQGRDAIVRAACAEGLRTEPEAEVAYSDLGMILLMACLERAGGAPFADLVQREVLTPLGMGAAAFARSGKPCAAPPTEQCAWRGRVIAGEVHDENAFAMGGVSGHAGLFATAPDVARVGLLFLAGGGGFLPTSLARTAIRHTDLPAGSTRALGFDTFVPGGSGGSLLHATAFGHTGFTGTSMWCDPSRDLCIVLLSNRVHKTRVNAKIARVRRALHDAVVQAME
jgi:CubicO group peptidase (beta-lactamase class C family)